MDQKTFSILLEKYLRGNISQDEVNSLLNSLDDDAMRQQWEQAIAGMLTSQSKPRSVKLYAVAATLLALLVTGIFFFTNNSHPAQKLQATTPTHTITPGSNKATLTLADGSQISLDSASNGAIAHQGNVQVIKLNNGQLAYKADATATNELHYNSLVTPRGGQFMIILPDGSKVWLNAATTLRYPTAFRGKSREVQLRGEAYFEIAPNAQMPFTVKVNNMEVKVLGTHFNIMGYPDENSIQTTLLEGTVQVRHNAASIRLNPGQQAFLQGENMTVKKDIDVDEIVAWKHGYFHFNHESLPGVMRQISRWYDVEVIYEANIPEREFGGKIERNSSLNDVLKILELSNVHYKIKERKIIITS
ncbi:FecR domain-containing protein [Chitinophaga sp.]|uniref:FecR family protein n=1 Tax=Chitinophaga sp. TaxID=1869181 RepID=UPI0031D78806